MRRVVSLSLLFVVQLILSCPSVLHAQSASASLTGYITDPSKAVILDAKVIVINSGTNVRHEVVSDKTGSYYVTNLPPGTYRIEVEKPGFKAVIKPDIVLHVQDTLAVNFELALGSVSETVTVAAGATQINTTDATVGTTVDRQFVSNLPLNGRSLQSLILLTPGVVVTPEGSSAGQFSVNGQRSNANYFSVDGVSANTGGGSNPISSTIGSQQMTGSTAGLTAQGATMSLVSIDALEEFKIQTSTYSAEFGRQPGGQVQLVTRSGTNALHGTAFEYLRNEAMDARNWFNQAPAPKPPLRQSQFGGTLGGPVVLPGLYNGKNRTFFFFSYEGLRLRLPTSINTLVPSVRLRQQAPAAVQPILKAWPLPTGPELTEDPTLPYDPVTNPYTGTAPFLGSYGSPSTTDAISIRADHTVNSRMTLFGRYADTPSSSLKRFLSQLSGDKNRARTLTIGATLSLTPRLSNQFRFNYSSNRSRFTSTIDNFGGAVATDPSVLISGYSGSGIKSGLALLIYGGMGAAVSAADPSGAYQRQFNVVDNISLSKGAHQYKFGIDYRRLAPVYGPAAYAQGNYFFSLDDVLSATPSFVIIDANRGARPLLDNFSAYAQDTWRVSPRLTLDLGLRWEVNPAPHDANGLKPVLVTGINGTDTSGATLAPPNSPFYKTLYTAFAPRVGAAYLLRQSSGLETVVRGGFGVYYDLGSGQALAGFGTFPFSASTFLSGVPLPLSPTQAQPPTFPAVQLPLTNVSLNALNPNLVLPYTLQWNVAVEQSLGQQQAVTLSYVASAGRRLIATHWLNRGVGNPSVSPNPNFGSINYTSNGPTSDYESLQVQYRRQLSHGLQVLANYTWSHAIDEISDENSPEKSVSTLIRGNSAFDVRHNFSSAVTYNIPKPNAGRVLTPVFRDWSIDSTIYVQSGTPFDLFAGQTVLPNGTVVNVRPDVVPGQPFWIKDSTVPGGRRLNPAAFITPPMDASRNFIRQGTLGRNVVRGLGRYQVNIALGRKFSLRERWNLQFKAEAFNLLNHPLFDGYGNNVRGYFKDFGVPRDTLNNTLGGLNALYQMGGPRSMQVSLKLSF